MLDFTYNFPNFVEILFNRAEAYSFGAIRFDFGAIRFRFGAIRFREHAKKLCWYGVPACEIAIERRKDRT